MPVDTIPFTPKKLDAATAGGREGAAHRGGQTLYKRKLSDSTSPSRAQFEVEEQNLDFERTFKRSQLAVEQLSGELLKVGVHAGYYRKSDGTDVWFAGSASVTIPDATSNYMLWIDHASGNVTGGVAWPADKTTFTPLAVLDTAAGAITENSIRDATTLVSNQVNASSTSPTGTTATAFTLDDDNAGAGATCQLRVNRGTDNAEDAALEWDEANDRWNARAQHSTATLAPLNASKLAVGGVDVTDTDGDIVAAAIDQTTLYTFAANGATAYGVRLTPAGGAGAPSAGAHTAGELAVDSAGVLYVCTADGTPGTWAIAANQLTALPASIVTAAALGDALADALVQVSIADTTSGTSPMNISVQLKDAQGNNLAETCYLALGVYQDADGAADATNVTLGTPSVGTFLRWITSNKVGLYKTNASGALTIPATFTTTESVYALAAMCARSKRMDCSDVGTITKT